MSQPNQKDSVPHRLTISIYPAGNTSANSKTICVYCRAKVINATFCPVCTAPYHPSCANNKPLAPSGGFSKYCGSSTPSISNQDSQVSLDTTNAANIQLMRTCMRKELSSFKSIISDDIKRLTTIILELSINPKSLYSKVQ